MEKITNKIIVAVAVTFVVAGLLGFFGGILYEKQLTTARFQQMRGNTQGRRPSMGTGTSPTFGNTVPAQ